MSVPFHFAHGARQYQQPIPGKAHPQQTSTHPFAPSLAMPPPNFPSYSSTPLSPSSMRTEASFSPGVFQSKTDEDKSGKRMRLHGGLEEVITLIVGLGDSEKSFIVHKDVLCGPSVFFRATCKPEWMEADKPTIKMPEDDPQVVRAMIYWMYHDVICIPAAVLAISSDKRAVTTPEAMEKPVGFLIKLYVVAEKYQIVELKNDAIDAISLKIREGHFDAFLIPFVYENTSSSHSTLRRLFIKVAQAKLGLADMDHRLDRDFYMELSCQFMMDKTVGVKDPFDVCAQLHNHEGASHGLCSKLKAAINDPSHPISGLRNDPPS